MKPETFVCIQGSPGTPKGSRAGKIEKDGTYYVVSFDDGKEEHYLGSMHLWQVEQNPECWQPQSEVEYTAVGANGSTFTFKEGKEEDRLRGAKHKEFAEQERLLHPNENKRQRVGTECTHPTQSPAKQDIGEGETNYFICDDCKEPC